MKHLSFALLVLCGVAGCGEVVPSAAEGSLGGACHGDGTCDNGLACENNACVGTPVVVRGTKNGHNRADLAIFPGGCSGGYWTGDGFRLMANALNF